MVCLSHHSLLLTDVFNPKSTTYVAEEVLAAAAVLVAFVQQHLAAAAAAAPAVAPAPAAPPWRATVQRVAAGPAEMPLRAAEA